MKKLFIAAGLAAASIGVTAGTASAAPETSPAGCKAGWSEATAVSDAALFVDRNGDGTVCFKTVNGRGNGNVANLGEFLITNSVVVDNFVFPGKG